MAQTDYTAFVTNKSATRGEPVSVPAVIGSVALLYNNGGLTTRLATKAKGTGKTGYSALGATFNAPLKKVGKSCIGA